MKLWFLFQEHQNTDVGLYGVDISVQAENMTIEIKEGSNKGLSLMKVLSKGNFFPMILPSENLKPQKD